MDTSFWRFLPMMCPFFVWLFKDISFSFEIDLLNSEKINEFYEYEEDLEALNYQFIINNKESFLK